MKYGYLPGALLAVWLAACSAEDNAAQQKPQKPVSISVPAVRLTSFYADKLQCPVLPDPPPQTITSYPHPVSPPPLQGMVFKACLKLKETAGHTVELNEAGQKIWQDFQCRIGYSPQPKHLEHRFDSVAVAHKYAKDSPQAKQIMQKFVQSLPGSGRVREFAAQQDMLPDCDVTLSVIPAQVNSDMPNEIWHICYPDGGRGNLSLLCSEKTGCRCDSPDEYHQQLAYRIKDINFGF